RQVCGHANRKGEALCGPGPARAECRQRYLVDVVSCVSQQLGLDCRHTRDVVDESNLRHGENIKLRKSGRSLLHPTSKPTRNARPRWPHAPRHGCSRSLWPACRYTSCVGTSVPCRRRCSKPSSCSPSPHTWLCCGRSVAFRTHARRTTSR